MAATGKDPDAGREDQDAGEASAATAVQPAAKEANGAPGTRVGECVQS